MAITLDFLIELMGKHAHHVLIERQLPALVPVYHLIVENEESLIMDLPFNNPTEKLAMVEHIRRVAHQRKATMLGFVSEAWSVEYGPKEKPNLIDPPAENPRRVEVVIAHATDGRTNKSRTWHMIRDKPGGKLLDLKLVLGDEENRQVHNRLTDGILPQRRRK